VLLLLLTFKGLLFISSGVEYYVKPTPDTQCPEPCHTFSHYIPMTPLVPNVTFHFLPWVFTLKHNGLLCIQNADGIALIGSEQYTVANLTNEGYPYHIPASEIECFGTTGIAFCAGNNIVIKYLRMRNCYIALQFTNTTDVNIFQILVENSYGIGMDGMQMWGSNSIVGSAFVKNTRNARFDYSKFEYEAELNCPASQNMVTSTLEIDRSCFLQGHQDLPVIDAGGLIISIQGFPLGIFIQVTDTAFFQNRGGVGGNMAVYIQGQAELHQNNNIRVEICSFVKGTAHAGGGIALVINDQFDNIFPLQLGTLIQVSSSWFHLNHATVNTTNKSNCVDPYCGSGGAVLIVLRNHKPVNVLINNCYIQQNSAHISGGGIQIVERTYFRVVNMISIVNHTVLVGGSAGKTGGGISYINEIISLQTEEGNLSYHLPTNFQLYQTNFSENIAGAYGGALVLLLQGASSSSNQIFRRIEIMDCDITNSTGQGTIGAASVFIRSMYLSFSHKVIMANVSIHGHGGVEIANKKVKSSIIAVVNSNDVHLINCSFYNNNQTALMALVSRLTFHGNVTFMNNRGEQGGALALYDSGMYLDNNTLLVFKDNKAGLQGGGIYVAKKISLGIPYSCFFQILTPFHFAPLSQFNIRIIMENNTAPSGSALYGGSVDFCWSTSMLVDNENVRYPRGKWIFDTIFQIKPNKANDPSVISSAALNVCFCENGLVQCNERVKNATTYPGGILNTTVVTVGQRNGTAPGHFDTLSNVSRVVTKDIQSSRYHAHCTNLMQRIYTQEKAEIIQILVIRQSPNNYFGVLLSVTLLDCPPGFILTPN